MDFSLDDFAPYSVFVGVDFGVAGVFGWVCVVVAVLWFVFGVFVWRDIFDISVMRRVRVLRVGLVLRGVLCLVGVVVCSVLGVYALQVAFWPGVAFSEASAGLYERYGVVVSEKIVEAAFEEPGVSSVVPVSGGEPGWGLYLFYDVASERFTLFETVDGVTVGEYKG